MTGVVRSDMCMIFTKIQMYHYIIVHYDQSIRKILYFNTTIDTHFLLIGLLTLFLFHSHTVVANIQHLLKQNY